jgi:outer membrane lipoprotein-sorting protein
MRVVTPAPVLLFALLGAVPLAPARGQPPPAAEPALTASGATTSAADSLPDGDAVLAAVDANAGSRNKQLEATMIIHGRRGTRTLRSRSWIEGTRRSFTEFLEPARERGIKMLKLEDQLWTYTPATDRIIKISGHLLRQPVMGSDLSYEDLMDDPRLSQLYTATIAGQDTVLGRPCWVLDLVSRGKDIAYHTRRIWVDRERLVLLREERHAKSGRLLKRTDVRRVDHHDGRWIASHVVFRDMLKGGDGTEFRLESIDFDVTIPAHLFSKSMLRR